jgi:hypothetical protein
VTRPALPLAQIAAMMNVAPADAIELAHRHSLPYTRHGADDIRVACDDVSAWLAVARLNRCPDGDV